MKKVYLFLIIPVLSLCLFGCENKELKEKYDHGVKLIENKEWERATTVFKDLDERGVYVMLSNHNTILVKELYKDYHIYVIEAKRNINSNGKKRGKVEEVIITNFENKKGFE